MPNQNNVSALLAKMLNAFRAMPKSAVDDLHDQLDSTFPNTPGDQWNDGSRGLVSRVATGPAESASGSGAEKMVSDYSKDIQPGNGITQGYADLSAQLSTLSTRMEKSESAIVAIKQFFETAMKGDAAAMFGAGKEDDKPDEEGKEDPDGNSTKGKVHVDAIGGVPALMRALSGASRDTGKTGLQTPPDLATIRKGADALAAEIEFQGALGNHEEVMRLRIMRMRQNALAAGAVMPDYIAKGADLVVRSPGSSRTGF
jgi:hypothetical protein